MKDEYLKTKEWIEKDLGWNIKKKEDSKFHKFLSKIIFWNDYINIWTTFLGTVWLPEGYNGDLIYWAWPTLQHEAVHILDMDTFFGLLPEKLKYVNRILFKIAYFFPQCLFVFGLLGFVNPWMFLCLLFLLPFPAPFRAIAEFRGYRRSLEIFKYKEDMAVRNFTGPAYYFMWPFKKHVIKMLKKDSPYQKKMDKIIS